MRMTGQTNVCYQTNRPNQLEQDIISDVAQFAIKKKKIKKLKKKQQRK